MNTLRLTYPLPLLCRVLGVSRSGYYAWLVRPPSKRAQEDGRLEIEIKAAHKRTRETCGPERLQRDLAAHGVKVGILRIQKDQEEARASVQTGQEIQGDDALEPHPACSGESSRSRFYCNGAQPGLGERSELYAHR